MASHALLNLKALDVLPNDDDHVGQWRIRFKYLDPRTNTPRVKRVHHVGNLASAQAERDRLKLCARQGLDPDDAAGRQESAGQGE